jgi:hypothetical protein
MRRAFLILVALLFGKAGIGIDLLSAIPLCVDMNNKVSLDRSPDRILTGVALMLGFCLTAPLLDVAAKLASTSIPVGQITTARFAGQCVLMAPVLWIMGLSFRVGRGQWGAMCGRP